MDDIMVSIVCNTYNQESYIRDALNGFVMQKTTFPFEILIHDDASTDLTGKIIEEFSRKYPDIIFPIFQKANQYSKGISITKTYQLTRARGKYIAFCEGDDYWTDPLKLQKQVDILEKHASIDICAHQMLITCGEKNTGVVPNNNKTTIYSVEQVILGGGGFVATASLMFRKKLFIYEYEFSKMLSLDYIWQIAGALQGGMFYLGDCMGVYRKNAKGSWTALNQKDPSAQICLWREIQEALCVLNLETNMKYEVAINKQIAMLRLNPWIRCGEIRKIFSKEGRNLLALQSCRQRVLIILQTLRRWFLQNTKTS